MFKTLNVDPKDRERLVKNAIALRETVYDKLKNAERRIHGKDLNMEPMQNLVDNLTIVAAIMSLGTDLSDLEVALSDLGDDILTLKCDDDD